MGQKVERVYFVKPDNVAREIAVLRHGDAISGFMQLDGEKVVPYSPYDSPF